MATDNSAHPCLINADKFQTPYLFSSPVPPSPFDTSPSHIVLQPVFSWINLILLLVFTPTFLIVAFNGYKLNSSFNFEIVIMIIAACYNVIVGISMFAWCDDFLVLLTQITSSSILLYMFFRF
jgi:hypothetical protein